MEQEIDTNAPAASTALMVSPTGFAALIPTGITELKEIIEENFGGAKLTMADIEKITVPAAGGINWVIATPEGDKSVDYLEGVILGWHDKKAWWAVNYGDSEGRQQPDCKSNDLVYGYGNPNKFFTENEKRLVTEGKANAQARRLTVPGTDREGYTCASCPHNQFGGAAQGKGKACQDKRWILFLFKDSLLPALIRVPATSIPVLKEYFKRLTTAKTSHMRTVTRLSLEKIKAAKDYSRIITTATARLTPEEIEAVKQFREPFMEALRAEDSVEQGYADGGSKLENESFDDMPTHTGGSAEDGQGDPISRAAAANGASPKQMGMLNALAREKNASLEAECQKVLNCGLNALTKKSASALIGHLQDMAVQQDAVEGEVEEVADDTPVPPAGGDDDEVPF